jgi:hypothetical protein
LLPPEERSNWWVDRMGIVSSLAGSASELLGPAADAVPLAATLRIASRGLVTCAVAREHAVIDPSAQARLLGQVLLGRDVAPNTASASPVAIALDPTPGPVGIVRSTVRIGRDLLALHSDLAAGLEIAEDGPRRSVLGRIPAVGVIRSFTDQRSTLRADADQVSRLVTGRNVSDEFPKEKGAQWACSVGSRSARCAGGRTSHGGDQSVSLQYLSHAS